MSNKAFDAFDKLVELDDGLVFEADGLVVFFFGVFALVCLFLEGGLQRREDIKCFGMCMTPKGIRLSLPWSWAARAFCFR